MDTKFKYLGCANNWKEIPDKVKKCAHPKERVTQKQDNGYWKVMCPICNYVYEYDSSD